MWRKFTTILKHPQILYALLQYFKMFFCQKDKKQPIFKVMYNENDCLLFVLSYIVSPNSFSLEVFSANINSSIIF